MKLYDYIILGTGQSTGTLLGKLIPTEKSIAVIEGNKIGGSCVNYGCTPTKALVASAKAIHQASRGEEFGFNNGKVEVDFSRVMERMNEIRGGSHEGLSEWIKSTENIDLYEEWGSFESDSRLKVGDTVIEGKHIFINTGTRPAAPPIDGIEEVNWLDSERLLELDSLPEHLVIIGGGYIGVEFAQVFRRFGSEVTIIQRGPQLMPQEDEDVAGAIQDFLEEEGINVLTNASAKRVENNTKGIAITVNMDGDSTSIQGSHLLVAAGRKPNSSKLNLENTSITTNKRGFIEVDDFCLTSAEGVYAVGDVNGHGGFTHTAVYDAEIVIDHLFNNAERCISKRIPIYGLFTDPPLGKVGLSEKAALEKGINLLKAIKPMKEISRAKEMSETRGFAKLLVDADTDLIIGAAILGPGGDEIVNMFAAIMHSNIPCKSYREVMLIHPTVSELMPFVLDGLEPVE